MDGIGVERTFPLYSPMIDSVEMVRRSKVRRAKLYFVREKATKEIRRQMRRTMEAKYEEEVIPPPAGGVQLRPRRLIQRLKRWRLRSKGEIRNQKWAAGLFFV